MSMSFDRLRAQIKCETLVGCTDLDKWISYRSDFESLTLDSNKVSTLRLALWDDAEDLYFKGLLSLSEAIYSVSRHLYSWATVKAYYALFYLLRSSLAIKDNAIVRNKCIYLFPISVGEIPQKKSSDKYRGDHTAIINIYQDLYGYSDVLQSNTIDNQNSYEWLLKRREQVNYHQREFYDPEPPEFLQSASEQIDNNRYDLLISTYVNDKKYIYCFQTDHACLALPIKRLLLTKEEFTKKNHPFSFPEEKEKLVRKLLVFDSKPLSSVEELISQ